jgi:hypothetical protein
VKLVWERGARSGWWRYSLTALLAGAAGVGATLIWG